MNLEALTNDIDQISQAYTKKFNISRTDDWFMLKLQEELGELTQAYLMLSHQARAKEQSAETLRETFEQELADTFCHLLLLSKHHNVNLEQAVADKWLVWKSNPAQP